VINTPPKHIVSSDWIALARHKAKNQHLCRSDGTAVPRLYHCRGQRSFAFLFIDKKTATYLQADKQIE
jgi:hypothetical protein